MQTTYLETLLSIRRFGSFSAAAKARNMTLSALSMQMKTLEQELGVALFDRSFRPPRLTPTGERIAEDARQVVEAATRLKSHCSEPDALNGRFQIGFVTSIAARALAQFLKAAQTRAPDAQFSFETGLSENLCQGVRAGRLDAAIATEIAEATTGLISHPILQEEMVLVTPNAHAALAQQELATRLPFFHFMPNSGIGRLIAQVSSTLDAAPRQSIYLDNIESIVSCVSAGLGYSLLPREEVRRYGQGQVQGVSCQPEPFFRTLSMITRADPLSEIWRGPLLEVVKAGLGGSRSGSLKNPATLHL